MTTAHAEPAAKKKIPFSERIWLWVGFVIVVGVGVIVLFTLAGALFTEGLNSTNTAIQSVSSAGIRAMNSLGIGLPGLLRATSTTVAKSTNALIAVLIWPVILFFIIRAIWKEIKKAKDGDGHGSAAH